MWALFTPTVFTDQNNGIFGTCTLFLGGCISSQDLSNAKNDLNNALAQVNAGSITSANFDSKMGVSGVTIYTDKCVFLCFSTPPEMISVSMVGMPEPWSPALLGIDLLGVAALAVIARRRLAHPNSVRS
jgi:hypothetical protein